MHNEELFEFNLSQNNKLKPKQLDKIDMQYLIRRGKTEEINNIINDYSKENFEENEYFDFKKDERKLVKTYQILTQYLLYSINHLKKKNHLVTDLAQQQKRYNDCADQILHKQKMKLKELELVNNDLTNNCISMEHIMKHLKLDDVVMKLGIGNTNNFGKSQQSHHSNNPMRESEYEKIKNEVGRDDFLDNSLDQEDDVQIEEENNK